MKTKREHARAAIAEKVKMRIQRDEAIKLAVDSVELSERIFAPTAQDLLDPGFKKKQMVTLDVLDKRRRTLQSALV